MTLRKSWVTEGWTCRAEVLGAAVWSITVSRVMLFTASSIARAFRVPQISSSPPGGGQIFSELKPESVPPSSRGRATPAPLLMAAPTPRHLFCTWSRPSPGRPSGQTSLCTMSQPSPCQPSVVVYVTNWLSPQGKFCHRHVPCPWSPKLLKHFFKLMSFKSFKILCSLLHDAFCPWRCVSAWPLCWARKPGARGRTWANGSDRQNSGVTRVSVQGGTISSGTVGVDSCWWQM